MAVCITGSPMQAAAVLRPLLYIGNTGENFTGGANFHAVPPARVRPPPATLRPLVSTPGVGPHAPRCPLGAGLARAGRQTAAAGPGRLWGWGRGGGWGGGGG